MYRCFRHSRRDSSDRLRRRIGVTACYRHAYHPHPVLRIKSSFFASAPGWRRSPPPPPALLATRPASLHVRLTVAPICLYHFRLLRVSHVIRLSARPLPISLLYLRGNTANSTERPLCRQASFLLSMSMCLTSTRSAHHDPQYAHHHRRIDAKGACHEQIDSVSALTASPPA